MFSKACEYAIKASIYIAQQSLESKCVNVKEVAASINAPVAFTAKVLQQLCRKNILQSVRGKQGGFVFDRLKQTQTTIFDIVRIVDGDLVFTQCTLGLHVCSSANPCPVHDDFSVVRQKLLEMTKKHSLYDLALKTENGLAWLK